MARTLRILVWTAVGIAAFYTLLAVTVGVSFDRLVSIDNDPLTNAVEVASISGNKLSLKDGRVAVMLGYEQGPLEQAMRESAWRVEIGPVDSGYAWVFVKKKTFICLTHAPVFIPVVRKEYPGYGRWELGLATLK